MLEPKTVYIDDLRIDPEVQPRVSLNKETIEDIAEAFVNNADVPRIEVHIVAGIPYLCDGFHRTAAARKAGRKSILALVEPESTRAKLLIRAVQANAYHAQALTRSERRNSVIRLVESMNKLGEPWTQDKIAQATGYTQPQISRILSAHFKKNEPEERPRQDVGYETIRERVAESIASKPPKNPSGLPAHPSTRELDMDIELKRAQDHGDWLVRTLRQARMRLNKLKNLKCGSEVLKISDELDRCLDGLWEIERNRPKGICTRCHARGCEACRHKGWITHGESRGR